MSRVRKFIESNKNILILLAALILYAVIISILGIGCPIKYVTGVSCAGCGMTRAWLRVAAFDFKEAFSYHPLYPVIPILAVIVMARKRMRKRTINIIIVVTILLFLAVYFIRMFNPNDSIVVFEPKRGILSNTVKLFS